MKRSGLLYAFGAYGIWGFFPIYFAALLPANPYEVVAYRVIFSLVFCLLVITLTRNWSSVWAAVSSPRVLFTLLLASLFIYINWVVFIVAVDANQVLETSLGYFINPLVYIALGVMFFGEKLRALQWIAVGIGAIAVLIMSVTLGQVPWIALILAFSFAFYGFVKKRVGGRVSAITGLTVETAWVLPFAIIQLIVVSQFGALNALSLGPSHAILMICSGFMTAVPLMLFASAAKRLPLTVLGFIQYFTPVSSFFLGIYYFHESMPAARWIGFVLVWVALVFLTVDMVRQARRNRASRLAPAEQLVEPLPE